MQFLRQLQAFQDLHQGVPEGEEKVKEVGRLLEKKFLFEKKKISLIW